ncbi:unnamed protein product [Plutella xylostella]|uniref:(diamondback moth) hypothetical protein n=1 Tax=Plutella xylostella TaxID=51655 RepID=A0A8S4FA47_PLUXY|nr:unnamed protein product [Plutella xylostella]
MKTVLILAALAVIASGAVVKTPLTRQNLNIGTIGARDRILLNRNVLKYPANNAIQSEDLIYRGNYNITAIRATERGYTQYANAFLISGGVGRRNATIRFQSARGYGYNYDVVIYGR